VTDRLARQQPPADLDPGVATAELAAGLRAAGTAERAAEVKRYLKSDLDFLGVRVPAIRQAVRGLRGRHPDMSSGDLAALVEALWRTRVFELRLSAVELLRGYERRLGPADLGLVERLLRDSGTWALVDPLASGIAGGLALRPGASGDEVGRVLDRWAGDTDFWIRRSALLALLPGVRSGAPDLGRLDRYGEAMLAEREFFIRKAIGWVLRELSTRDPAWVGEWVAPRTHRISGVTIREAVRHLPAADGERLMDAYRKKVPAV
jgi:3-methyladenine DNA glycosylase AlkD